MNHSHQKHIAAQALKAMQLRRQLERGEVTQDEYLIRLNALQSSSVAATPPTPFATTESDLKSAAKFDSTATERPSLMSALEVLQLRRRLDNGELSRQEYQAQLHAGMDQDHSAANEADLTDKTAPGANAPVSAPRAIMAPPAIPTRSMVMKCPRCTADLRIYDHTCELRCTDCDAEVLVERMNCTISLRLLEEDTVAPEIDPTGRTAAEVAKLQAEAAMLINVKRVAGLLGLLSAALSGYAGMVGMAAQRPALATSVLFCGSALLGTVVCITRHTSKVREQLTTRIRALTLTEE